ncbi:MAG: hypothetical protein AAF940_07365 [Pseudomonadota bacterium]
MREIVLNRRAFVTLAASSVVLAGCTTLETEDESGEASVDQIILVRGLANIFSTGLDRLGDRLEDQGLKPTVVGLGSPSSRARTIAAKTRNNSRRGAVVLVGHSYGADEAIRIANSLDDEGVKVDLLLTFDPTISGPVSKNVRHAINYHTTSAGMWGPIKAGDGFNGRLNNVNVGEESDDNDRINHFNVEKAETLHERAVREIKRVVA